VPHCTTLAMHLHYHKYKTTRKCGRIAFPNADAIAMLRENSLNHIARDLHPSTNNQSTSTSTMPQTTESDRRKLSTSFLTSSSLHSFRPILSLSSFPEKLPP